MSDQGSRAFYRLRAPGGPDCFSAAVGNDLAAAPGLIACAPNFPSANLPILDFTILRRDSAEGAAYVWTSGGIAADGVTKVELLHAGQTVATADVANNTYSFDSDAMTIADQIRALDASGNVVYTKPLIAP